MGTFLAMEGLVDAQKAGYPRPTRPINHIMLASPDIDIDLFRTQLDQLAPAIREKMYLLVSSDDRALRSRAGSPAACRAWAPPTRRNWKSSD
jgi:esterase/lipase superfamily enzyme